MEHISKNLEHFLHVITYKIENFETKVEKFETFSEKFETFLVNFGEKVSKTVKPMADPFITLKTGLNRLVNINTGI